MDLTDIQEYAANSEKLYLCMAVQGTLAGFEFTTSEVRLPACLPLSCPLSCLPDG